MKTFDLITSSAVAPGQKHRDSSEKYNPLAAGAIEFDPSAFARQFSFFKRANYNKIINIIYIIINFYYYMFLAREPKGSYISVSYSTLLETLS